MRLWEIQQAMLNKRILEGINCNGSDRLRPRITFRHIQQLRKLRDQRAAERAANLEFLPLMYAVDEAGGAEKSKGKSANKKHDQWQKKQSKAALRAIKDRQREHEKSAKAVHDDIKERRKRLLRWSSMEPINHEVNNE